jgi:ABC-type ATPase with predicted acetyltransferase domain
MERISVKSSNIEEVGYDPGSQVLEVKFKNGGVFQYQGVSAKEVVGLHEAESVGKYLHTNIKPNHECRKVNETKEGVDD